MSLATLLFATASLAINFGWQKADDGYEYLVQLEPETLRLMNEGIDVPIDSHVPEGVQPIRRIRIVVGKAELPRDPIAETEGGTAGGDIERTAFYRPGDPTTVPPPANGTYPPPAAPQPIPNNAMVQPLRDVDSYLQDGFQSGVNGLDKTGQAIRGAVDNVNSSVQDQFQKGKEFLVGPSPTSTYPPTTPVATTPYGAPAAPTYGTPPTWPAATASNANTPTAPLSGLPAPPLATDSPSPTAAPAPNAWGTTGPQIPDNRVPTAATSPSNTGNGRMVPIEPPPSTNPAASVPTWDPKWPDVPTTTAFTGFPGTTPPETSTSPTATAASQPPAATNGGTPTSFTPPPSTLPPAAANSTESNAHSVGDWLLAMVVLVGSIALNLFLGLNYLDIRNKYRAALRRTSRSFGRPAASA